MINKTEWDRMIQGKLYNPYKVGGNTFETVHQNTGMIKVLLKN